MHFSAFVNLATENSALLPLWRLELSVYFHIGEYYRIDFSSPVSAKRNVSLAKRDFLVANGRMAADFSSPEDNLPHRRARNAGEADHFEHLTAKQEQQKIYYDERARATPLSPVVPSQPVVIRNESTNKWEPAIVKSTDQHRSAIVETPQGKTLRRNRIDIRPVPPKQVRFEVPASEPQPTQHQSPEEVSQKASQPAATPSSTPEVSSAVQTRSGRTVKVPDKLNL